MPLLVAHPHPAHDSFFDKGTGAGYVRFRTTSQNYYDYDTKALSVGESNQGIVVPPPPASIEDTWKIHCPPTSPPPPHTRTRLVTGWH